MLETFHSTGMRRAELVSLRVHDVDHERGTVMIREGKGKRDRLIPIGERVLAWIRKYLDEVRPQIALANDEGALFLALTGDSIGTRLEALRATGEGWQTRINAALRVYLSEHPLRKASR